MYVYPYLNSVDEFHLVTEPRGVVDLALEVHSRDLDID